NTGFYLSEGEIFHTSYHIKYQYPEALGNKIAERLHAFDASLNPFNPSSIISKVNRNDSTRVDSLFIRVFNKANDVSLQSRGLFDITCAPLVNAWGFGFQGMDTVRASTIDSILPFVGYHKVRLVDGRVLKDDPRILLNCSAIAKGYSCDIVAGLFDSLKVANYMIEIGGEIRAKGKNPNGACWKVEIPKPIDDTTGFISERQDVLEICDKSIATSGNYRNYYLKDGKKYAHTINPLTGYPAASDMLSASVIANDCMTADAYATAFMTMGVEASCRLVEKLRQTRHEYLDYYFIYTDKAGRYRVRTNLFNHQ
ncbi:MAG: FAD:protein FMN transferase, partial [Dysgonamonadaceae bacterium]|nr:FAD:protein FMN transferase [Dysgonamonadaceae bacterium]